MTEHLTHPRPIAGYLGFAVGAVALLLVLMHFWGGPFAPQQGASVSLGEFAAEIRQAATRTITGASQPAPESTPWDIDRGLKLVTALLAGIAVILGAAGIVRRENRRPAIAAIALGGVAVVFQFFVWMALLLVGALLISAIISNIDGILGG